MLLDVIGEPARHKAENSGVAFSDVSSFRTELSARWRAVLLCSDATMFIAATGTAVFVASHLGATLNLRSVAVTAVLSVCLLTFMFEAVGLYRKSLACDVRDECYQTIAALAVTGMPFLILFTVFPPVSTSRMVVLLSMTFAAVTVPAMRGAIYYARTRRAEEYSRPILVVGTRDRVGFLLSRLHDDGVSAMAFYADLEAAPDSAWLETAERVKARTVVFTEMIAPETLRPMLSAARQKGLTIAFGPPRFVQHSYELALRTIASQALLVAEPLRATKRFNVIIKRVMDIVLSLAGVLVFGPVMVICALAVYAETGRPILYRQVRVGKDGHLFEIMKFRSMPVNIEKTTGAAWSPAGDTRPTRVGRLLRRTSFDELPQLFNVLKGEMSVVGPRPERPIFVDQFRDQLDRYDERHLVAPGITGWSHVHMKRNHDQSKIGERLRYDLYYIQHWSIFMDLAVVFKTAAEFLFHKAA